MCQLIWNYQKIKCPTFYLRNLLLKTGLCLMNNVLKLSAKSVLIPLGLTPTASATEATITKKFFRFGMATLIISKEEIN